VADGAGRVSVPTSCLDPDNRVTRVQDRRESWHRHVDTTRSHRIRAYVSPVEFTALALGSTMGPEGVRIAAFGWIRSIRSYAPACTDQTFDRFRRGRRRPRPRRRAAPSAPTVASVGAGTCRLSRCLPRRPGTPRRGPIQTARSTACTNGQPAGRRASSSSSTHHLGCQSISNSKQVASKL
jgi:hypothetical protein